jgi:dTDP-4-dehydrorhamnose reductase
LVEEFLSAGERAYGTTRRVGTAGGDRLFLDLADNDPDLALPPDVNVVFLTAAMTGLRTSEVDASAYHVNVTNSVRVAQQVWAQGRRLVFLSSDTVFGGDRPFCNEQDALCPGIAYARHKAEAEARLTSLADEMGSAEGLTIVRLTKVLSAEVPPLPDWFARLEAGQSIRPFSDMTFAPVSLGRTAAVLRRIGDSGLPGVFHISGAENVSYVDFARRLVAELGLGQEHVVPTTSDAAGTVLTFRPRYSAMGMARSLELLGIGAEPLNEVVARIVASRPQPRGGS